MDENQAITLLKQCDLRGLEYLVRRYQVPAVHAAYLITGDRHLAEDVAQAAFLKVAEKIDQYDERRPFSPWFFKIVTNAALKASQGAARHLPLNEDEDEAIPPAWLVDPAAGPEALADTAETRRLVWQALQRLAPPQRAAVVMRYYLDMPENEIAQQQGRPLTTIKWSLHAARQRLRQLLSGLAPSRPPADDSEETGYE